MGYNSVPDRWEFYSKIGKIIPGSRIIPFKVPLREDICKNLLNQENKFTLRDLINENNEMKITMIIDLTLTDRFYNSKELSNYAVVYKKMRVIGGGQLPNESDVKTFCQSIKNHLDSNPQTIVGVHCTHGLNRTGYFICRYLIDYLDFSGEKAVKLFETCRGHEFDRINYKDDLMSRNMEKERSRSISQDTFSLSTTSTSEKISKKRKKRKSQNTLQDKIELSPAQTDSPKEKISKNKKSQHKSFQYEMSSVTTVSSDNKNVEDNDNMSLSFTSTNEKISRKRKRRRSRSKDKIELSHHESNSSPNERKSKRSKRHRSRSHDKLLKTSSVLTVHPEDKKSKKKKRHRNRSGSRNH